MDVGMNENDIFILNEGIINLCEREGEEHMRERERERSSKIRITQYTSNILDQLQYCSYCTNYKNECNLFDTK